MDIEYIVVQAGGLGTRLEYLTKNKPKAIVSVNNNPIVFHLFNSFPKAKFIIIGDYKYDVLEAYLETFAPVRYILVRSYGKGNACGINKAISYIPENKPFIVMWSDLILDEKLDLVGLDNGNYIGVTNRFTCSWRFQDNSFEKISSDKNGLAGFFIFKNKDVLDDVPEEGSFSVWLKNKGLDCSSLDMLDTKETGTLAAIKEIDHSTENRCRPYNKMTFTDDGRVIKEGITKEGKDLIKREEVWYEKVSEYNFDGIPTIYSTDPLIMKRIDGDNIFKANLNTAEKKAVIDKLVAKLDALHSLERAEYNAFDVQEDYYSKTLKRLYSIRNAVPFANQPYIMINGKKCKNVLYFHSALQEMVDGLQENHDTFGIIHGDGTLTNTMIDKNGDIYFIDARGYFGKTPLYGDVYYDWAKLYYSLSGRFDQFNVKKFELTITDEQVEYEIEPSGWESVTDHFLSIIKTCDVYRIRLIHAIVWMSLASHCWDDYDSMCLAFYNGIYLWNELVEERTWKS